MTKKIITVSVAEIKYDLDGLTLKKAIARLQEFAETHGKDAVLDIGQEAEFYSDHTYAYVRLNTKREETDEEYEKRLKEEKYYTDMRAKADLEVYERVKKQLEGK